MERITRTIKEAYPESTIAILDKTREHIGHKELLNSENPQETHLDIEVSDAAFKGVKPIDSIRAINNLIKEEFTQGLHAVTISCSHQKNTE